MCKQPEAVSQALLPPLVVEMPRTEGRSPESRFDLAVNNAPAAEVFMAIASGTRYSMIVHPSINEKLSINLHDVTVFEALDTMRDDLRLRIQGPGQSDLDSAAVDADADVPDQLPVQPAQGQERAARELRSDLGFCRQPRTAGATAATTLARKASPRKTLQSSKIETTYELNFWTDLASGVRAIIGTG